MRGEETLEWWARRLRTHGVAAGEIGERDGRLTLDFEDPEGQRLALVDDGGQGREPVVWERSPVPAGYQVRGLGPIIMSVPDLRPTDQMLRQALGMRAVREYVHGDEARSRIHVYQIGRGGPHAELHVAAQPHLPAARLGAGGVHHVAFRTPTEDQHAAWTERVSELGIPNSGRVDRYYFRSLYFREPNGVLFEVATDGPGFGVDEDPATLGETVALPPFLESRRPAILANLKAID